MDTLERGCLGESDIAGKRIAGHLSLLVSSGFHGGWCSESCEAGQDDPRSSVELVPSGLPELARWPSMRCAALSIATTLDDLTDRTGVPLAGSGGFIQSPGSI